MRPVKTYLLNYLKKHISGKKRYQKSLTVVRNLAQQGLNFGSGGVIDISGELSLMSYLAGCYTAKRNYIVFDVGANQGDYSTALIKKIPMEDLQIWCFEPSVDTFKKLQDNHRDKNNILLNNIGFGRTKSKVPLYSDRPGSDIASLFPLERASGITGKLTEFEMVNIYTIDDFLFENNIPYIDFLKLDIEGNELNALIGASNAIESGKIRAIQFEFGACNIDSRSYFRDFWNLLSPRYNLYRLVRDGLYPIRYYSENDEVFATINYYAELK